MLRRSTKLLSALALFFLVACDEGTEDECTADANAIAALEDSASEGAVVFSNSCGVESCHGTDGTNGAAPDLSSRAVGLSDTQIARTVLCGEGNMPAQAQLDDQEIADVVAYVQENFQ